MKWWLRWRLRVWERRMFLARGQMNSTHPDHEETYQGFLNEYATALGAVDYFRTKLDGTDAGGASK